MISLKSRKEFLNLKSKGRRVFIDGWLIINFFPEPVSDMELGCTIPKYVGNAVARNRFKRWTKEFFRELQKQNPHFSVKANVILRKQPTDFYKKLEYADYTKALTKACRKIQKFIS